MVLNAKPGKLNHLAAEQGVHSVGGTHARRVLFVPPARGAGPSPLHPAPGQTTLSREREQMTSGVLSVGHRRFARAPERCYHHEN